MKVFIALILKESRDHLRKFKNISPNVKNCQMTLRIIF